MSWIILASSYLLGSVPFGVLVARLLGKGDLREHGSGNTGALNVWRVAGVVPAVVVAGLDAAKGFAAAWAGMHFATGLYPSLPLVGGVLCALAAVSGHIWPIFVLPKKVELADGREKKVWGGKGLAPSAGALAYLAMPLLFQVVFGWVLYYLLGPLMNRFMRQGELNDSRRIAQASLTAALTLPVFAWFQPKEGPIPYHSPTLVAIFAVWTVILAIPQFPDMAPPPQQVKLTRQLRREKEREKEAKEREQEQKRREKEQQRRAQRKK